MEVAQIIRGRKIDSADIDLIRNLIKQHFIKGRKHISRELCHAWQWYQPSGHTKDRAARDILLAPEKQGLVDLPPGQHSGNNHKTVIADVGDLFNAHLNGSLKHHPKVTLKLLKTPREYALFRSLVHRYHYQGSKIIVGQSLRYFATIGNNPIACLGWGSAAWSIKSRDTWIGWNKESKDHHLGRIVNNIRFLILPWVKIKYLASHLLALSARKVPVDWMSQYKSPVYLLETFVEKNRFKGTCYKAANWIHLGETKGSAKRGSTHTHHGNIKDVYVYPLGADFRNKLLEG